jgi:glycine/D-amino acid oxidase-like deaminating enzyme
VTDAPSESFDAVVVGGGVMGCATALGLAQGGMRVAVVERRALGTGASGVNAGTLSLQIKRAALVPYALKGLERWRSTAVRLGFDVHYHRTGGLTCAFTDEEAETLTQRMNERKAAGVPLEIVPAARARALEPGLSDKVRLASWCAEDGYAHSTLTGRAYRTALVNAGVTVIEGEPVERIARDGGFAIATPHRTVRGRRLVLAGGAWLKPLAKLLGVDFPISVRVNTVSVTARLPVLIRTIVGHAFGLLTLKQSDNGTMLIGGGWQGRGDLEQGWSAVDPDNLVGNLRLAQFAVPALAGAQIVRSWLGFEAHLPDMMPLVGPMPGIPDAFVIGCVRGGYTIGPYMGELLSQLILGREPEMPLFNPARFNTRSADQRLAS